ncbi:hypothetical protein HN587_05305 [Candidatus Woesearchaeota archaeon]|jgi:hypothetical protein|nr:hypothetical protein [Candidatus Woesearchaeota archaeon]
MIKRKKRGKLLEELEATHNQIKHLDNKLENMRDRHNQIISAHKEDNFYKKLHQQRTEKKQLNNAILPGIVITLLMISGIISLLYTGGGITGSTVSDLEKDDSYDLGIKNFAKYFLSGAFFIILCIAGLMFVVHMNSERK